MTFPTKLLLKGHAFEQNFGVALKEVESRKFKNINTCLHLSMHLCFEWDLGVMNFPFYSYLFYALKALNIH
jgi:hypothetical protein